MTDDPQAVRDAAHPAPPPTHAVEELNDSECWRLLVHGRLGRLALVATDDAPDIFPVNYVASKDHRLYFRSAPGSKLMSIAAHHDVAFEIDGYTDQAAWSVVVRGVAERLEADDEIEASGVLELASWSPTRKHDFVRITPKTTTGRSFRLSSSTGSIPLPSSATGEGRASRSQAPQAIPSRRPSHGPSSDDGEDQPPT